ncbi:hypothetical protein CLIM01_06220 [Colletotrichum limetticola]|uniref:Uncharacterized protein n=1 Tax=Colletotrichum limetticola TaxID=1209924 RepID=A0ABQ9PY25_9PEZI|nr:hypothetical protein CLIM01_06220 [Colletotrichum limetticola]
MDKAHAHHTPKSRSPATTLLPTTPPFRSTHP